MCRGVVLTVLEREEISRRVHAGESGRVIARVMGRHQSVINREIARHGGRVQYRAVNAARQAGLRSRRPKVRRIEANPRLLVQVNAGLMKRFSPRQVSRQLVKDFPNDETMRMSHEQLYQALYLQARGQLRAELTGQLRRGGTRRVPRTERRRIAENKQHIIPSMVMISDRPAEAEDRAVPGHWEGDLVMGAANRSAIITLVERTSRFVILGKLNYDHTAWRTASVLSRLMGTLPDRLAKSLTWDQGREMAAHTRFTIATNIPVFFCDPHSPWQRGSNENTNGLLREYFPKGTELQHHSQHHLDTVADELNIRPRQTLSWLNPAEKLHEILAEADGALTA